MAQYLEHQASGCAGPVLQRVSAAHELQLLKCAAKMGTARGLAVCFPPVKQCRARVNEPSFPQGKAKRT